MIDDRTPLLDLPLPNVNNLLTEDVGRLRSALGAIDTAVAGKADLVGGKVPAGQLPAYVDDVVEYANFAALPATGAQGIIYVTIDTTPVRQWRWSGSAYAEIAPAYQLPPATPTTLGGVKVGAGLGVTPEGEVYAVGGGGGGGVPVFSEQFIVPNTNGQTVLTPAGGYTPGQIQLLKNGVEQYGSGDDYTASNGTTITLTVGANTTDTFLLRRWIYLPAAQAVAKGGDTLTGALNDAPQIDVASAATTSIGLANANRIRVTGTNGITSLGTAAAGVARTVTFAASLTLTHNATSLILPGAANITTAAGDTAEFESLGSGNWRCTWYQRASGLPLASGGRPYVDIGTNTNAVRFTRYRITASLDLTLPASPTDGDWVDVVNTSGTTTAWVRRNGNNIGGRAEDMQIDSATATFSLVFRTGYGWIVHS